MEENFDFDIRGLSGIIADDTEFISLLSAEDEERMNKEELPEILSILPLRNNVLFPGVVIPITVGRDKSINLIKDAYRGSKIIGVTAQKDASIEDPTFDDIFKVGTVAQIIKVLQMPDGSTTAIIQGKRTIEIKELIQTEPYLTASIKPFKQAKQSKNEMFDALVSSLKDMAIQIVKKSPNMPSEASFAIKNIESSSFLINFISSNSNVDVLEKQKMLEINDLSKRADELLKILTKELQYLEIKNQIQSKARIDIDKQQKDYFLNQQLKAIQDELGGNPNEQQIADMLKRSEFKKWNEKIAEVFKKEMGKLQRMNPNAAEFSIQMNYVEMLLDLPWEDYTEDSFDLDNAQKVLDGDHYGLEKIKERIIEYLAVLKLRNDMKSPIICLVGPPGVGKTSLGKSIAKAINRNYIRMSLGGLHDESEIRGHRKTYIGALPGRIIQNLKKAKSSNPVFVLDEIDKIGTNTFHGDPSSALLEVLDPEQNNTFYDNYLEVDYDLSKVMFIATANSLNSIQSALRDRLEVINISGYIVEEKIEIAKRHLVPKQMTEHGLKLNQLNFTKDAIEGIIEDYTRESGVRELEKKIAKVIRYYARFIAMDKPYNKKIVKTDLFTALGSPIFKSEKSLSNNVAGVVTGLAWTSVGGDILFIEASLSKGKGNLSLTGNLGDVMKESATIAYEYLKSHADIYNIRPEAFENWNIHVHVPEGATPKDGPSAGVTMFTALVSAFTQLKVKQALAMTGEITLRGKVLPVGGIKEKILAAKRANIKEIILCEDNKKDIEEINQIYLKGLKFHYVSEMHEVIDIALTSQKVKDAKTI
ncbi:MAG: endopeptidase La [Bacteroidota bacterium]